MERPVSGIPALLTGLAALTLLDRAASLAAPARSPTADEGPDNARTRRGGR